jgi:Outer membrane protein beta-barrel domain
MKRAPLVATGLLAISTTTAWAGGFAGLALGTQPSVNAEMDALASPSGRSLRGFGGYRFGQFALEGAINGFGVATGRGDQTVYQASAAARFNLPIANGFEGFGRAGLERTWLSFGDERYDLTGNGFLVGAGIELRLGALIEGASLLTNASVFVDYTIHRATLDDARKNSIDETSGVWGLGVMMGF